MGRIAVNIASLTRRVITSGVSAASKMVDTDASRDDNDAQCFTFPTHAGKANYPCTSGHGE
ncbi:hypothetical protein KCP70_04975 [Salmonella enterica subsp. enterica]|nr:hypothetical protein KCP70_04975 [Salmonella enterica subsp. enterica]